MRRIRIFHTESFRLAALFAVLFVGLAGVLIGAVYWIVEDMQTTALVNVIDADINTISNGFHDKGLSEAIEVVQQRLGSPDYVRADSPSGYILLMAQDQGKLAGNLPLLPPRLGLASWPIQKIFADAKDRATARHAGPGMMLGRGVFLTDGVYLFVARDTATIAATRARILRAFAWITGVTIVLAACGGVFFSVQFMRRIDAITKTCNAIVAGRFDDRIALRGSDDELDRLARAINSMLDRIAALLDNLRQVSSDVAHDLRTPLTHLRQRLETARLKSATLDDYSHAVSRAIDDTDELLAIFTALLRISQIEAGTRVAAFAVLSLSELLKRLYEMYRPVAEDHDHTLQRDIREAINIRGDAELLMQLFVNLIENALSHTPAGTRIEIALKLIDGVAVASVSDNGAGIPSDERDKVFRRFYRVASSRTAPGNGLGLALVAAIVNLHQGKAELADNNPGLRVSISLPRVE